MASDDPDLDASDYVIAEESYVILVFFHDLKGYDAHIKQYITREYAPSSINVIRPPLNNLSALKLAISDYWTVFKYWLPPWTF